MTRLEDLPDLVLRPFAELRDDAWYVAPSGKWNSAQIVEHLAMGIEWSATGFDERRARDPMVRRPRTIPERVARVLVMHIGWFPPGVRAPSRAIPTPHVDRTVAEHRFRHAVQRHRMIAADAGQRIAVVKDDHDTGETLILAATLRKRQRCSKRRE